MNIYWIKLISLNNLDKLFYTEPAIAYLVQSSGYLNTITSSQALIFLAVIGSVYTIPVLSSVKKCNVAAHVEFVCIVFIEPNFTFIFFSLFGI